MISKLKDMFKKKEESLDEDKTIPLPDKDRGNFVSKNSVNHEPFQIWVGSAQSVGKVRDHNEDALYAMSTLLSEGTTETPFGIYIVADGMGGHQHGELASGAAIRVLSEYLIKNLYLPMIGLDQQDQGISIQELISNAVSEVQQVVLKNVPGGGTTLTVALLIGEQVTFAHVGDSRAYFLYPDSKIEVITHDHSLVQRLYELGQITKEEADAHPQKNVLYRAIGQNEPFQPDVYTHPIPRPGYLLLCSDGLWGQVQDDVIQQIIVSAANPSDACQKLVEAANEAGGPDNISAVLVQFLD